ncbi:MAG: T9SS type A sorting domain-containing protein [Candidatus Krumholzibacteriota bacterium]|nr:T9SS type A sorting domain-containing protein [Candidatus Krumholzibacteriota bacterium]
MQPRRLTTSFLLFVSIVALTFPAQAAWVDNGVRITEGERPEFESRIAPDGAGGAYIVWEQSFVSAFLKNSIFIQRIDGTGNILWGSGGISLSPDSTIAWSPADVSPDGSGGALVCWTDGRDSETNSRDVYAQRLDSNGNRLWGRWGAEVYTGSEDQDYPLIVSDGAGGAVIVWRDNRDSNIDLRAQRLDASGSMLWDPSGIPVCTDLSDQNRQQIATDGSGGVIVTWDDDRASSNDIYAQRVDLNGIIKWDLDGIPICVRANQQTFPRIVSDETGGAIITWQGSTVSLYAQRVDADGDTLWAANGIVVCSNPYGSRSDPQIAIDGSGGAVLCWYDSRTPRGIYGQRIDAAGDTLWNGAGAKICLAVGSMSDPRIASDGSGGAAIVWKESLRQQYDYGDVYAQTVDADGYAQGPSGGIAVCTAVNEQRYVHIATDSTGGGIITWTDNRYPATSQSDIYAGRAYFNGSTDAEIPDLPAAGYLSQNFPNPFNPVTTIEFGLERDSHLSLSIYDAAGRIIRKIVDEGRPAGHYAEAWDGKDANGNAVASGVYFFKLETETLKRSRKMILLR